MLPKIAFRVGKGVLSSAVRSAIVSMLLCGFCALSFSAPARANEGGTLFPNASQHVQFYSQPIRTFVTDHPATAPRWTLLPKASLEAIAPAIPSFQPFAESARPARVETYASLLPVRGFPLPKAALPPSPSRAGRGRWLALGIGGLAVTAAGAATYSFGNSGFPCGGGYPSNGCHNARTIGLVLIPVGGVMAVAGFVKFFQH